MKKLVSLRHALSDPHILGGLIDGLSWLIWRALLLAIVGEVLTEEEREAFRLVTGREYEPDRPVEEFWGVIGRRGGKSRALSVLAAYMAACVDWSPVLARGEVGVLPVLAATTRQAEVMLGYISALFADRSRPLFHKLRKNETQETVELHNNIVVEVRPASFKTSRGITAVSMICDEIAFWASGDGAANPDSEILSAMRPSLATTRGLLLAISSPHARKGELWNTYAEHFGPAGDPAILVAQAESRVMNPTLEEAVVDRALKRDPSSARAEWLAQFRSDVETFVSLDTVVRAVVPGREILPPQWQWIERDYYGSLDAAGGSGSDSMTMAVAHTEGDVAVLDCVAEVKPPFSPDAVVEQFAELFKSYQVSRVRSDKWGGDWVVSAFRKQQITVEPNVEPKSVIYSQFLPLLNADRIALLDHKKLRSQLLGLERKVNSGGRDTIDHVRNGHDDVINAAAIALVDASATFDIRIDPDALMRGMQHFQFALGHIDVC